MKAKEIFNKTMPFCMAKLALGAATIAISTVIFLITMAVGMSIGVAGLYLAIVIWLVCTAVAYSSLMHYTGYLVKAGHIAVIAEAVKTGQIPDNQVEYGKAMVQERFVESNVYFVVDKLVTGAVKQIQKGIEKVGNTLEFIPGMESLTSVVEFFVEISLGYIDECCFGWTFYNPEQGAFKSAADGVVIYAQNWKVLLKRAAITMVKVIIALVAIGIATLIPLWMLFDALNWDLAIAIILAFMISGIIKFAFIDSYIMCQTMVTYMEVAPTTEITFDLYGKLCNLSKSFKELFDKGQQEAPVPAYAGATVVAGAAVGTEASVASEVPVQNIESTPVEEPVKAKFCTSCGTKIETVSKFCTNCGAKM